MSNHCLTALSFCVETRIHEVVRPISVQLRIEILLLQLARWGRLFLDNPFAELDARGTRSTLADLEELSWHDYPSHALLRARVLALRAEIGDAAAVALPGLFLRALLSAILRLYRSCGVRERQGI